MVRVSLLLVLLAVSSRAQDRLPFPMRVVDDVGLDGLVVELAAERIDALGGLDAARLVDVPLPGDDTVTLELRRVRVVASDARVFVDGEPVPGFPLGHGASLWTGRVAGEPDSDVYLAFTPTGSRGWVRRGADMLHLLVEPGPNGGARSSTSRLVSEPRLRQTGIVPDWSCGTESTGLVERPAPSSEGTQAILPLLECRLAVETDTQFMQLFGGDLPAAQDYLVTLMGAVSSRYREQIGIVLTLVYTGFYQGADPWTTQETGGDGYDLIFEFLGAWDAGQAPVVADVYHLFSGSSAFPSLGAFGGVCSPDWAFSIGVGMSGTVPFPIVQGPLNWDFIVSAHEVGHVFGADHTHNYCPPIDQCSGSFGQCQTAQVCQSSGTIMSYCHNCPGGPANYTTLFHPDIVDIIRDFAEHRTCLQPFDGLFADDLGFALAGSAGVPRMDTSFTAPDTIVLDHTNAPAGALAFLVLGFSSVLAPFKGGVMVPNPQFLPAFTAPAASFPLAIPVAGSIPGGLDLWFQTWFVDAGGVFGFSATNGVQVELILSDPWPAPVWIPHPTNGMEYALSSPGSYAMARAQALAAGGDLAVVDSFALNGWLVSTFADPDMRAAFIGFSDAASEGSFAWESGAPIPFTNWGLTQPNDDSASGQDYAEIVFGPEVLVYEDDQVLLPGQWNDTLGSGWQTNRAIMERSAAP